MNARLFGWSFLFLAIPVPAMRPMSLPDIQLVFSSLPTVIEQIRAGKLRALADGWDVWQRLRTVKAD